MEEVISHNIYSNEYCSNDFFYFYSNIVSSTIFKKVENSNLAHYLLDNNQNKFKTIFKTETYSILYSNPILDKLIDNLYMISDPNDNHRFLLCVLTRGNYTSMKIFGSFIYFNSQGNVSELISIPKLLLNYDYRNGCVNELNTFLYNQTLIFIESHRDGSNYMITTCCFDYYDNLLALYTEYSNIKSKYFMSEPKQYNRFLTFCDKNDDFYVIDMGSTIVEKDTKKYIMSVRCSSDLILKYVMYSYKNTSSEDIKTKLETLKLKSEERYSDGYERDCIKCGLLTSCAIFYEDNTSLGLGNSYCHDCGIRYSQTENKWVCAKLAPKCTPYMAANFCRNDLNKKNGYICELIHDDRKLKFDYKFVEKKPYKKNGSVTIVNSRKQDENISDDYYEEDNTNSFADQAEEELKLKNPEKYDELMDSIRETLEEEKQESGYIKTLFMKQMDGVIDPVFVLPLDDDPNKLKLMME